MSWVATGVVAGTALLGAVQGEEQRKAQAKANRANLEMDAARTEFSPWTKIQPMGTQSQAATGGALSGAMQGGLSGAMFAAGNKMGGFGGGTQTPPQQPQQVGMLDNKYKPGFDPNKMYG